ncbi:NAD(P)/FAD-dependent oxidoreductase [Bordetella petrii]|uniref:NAD(P)/FAD-dependent oxidoreductase n=1 Tax=Bordetella petrii TaxID=94624 RepID=UPI001A971433|nr:FAD-binding oxidoreductase [Bordetella petrii]MBO1110672.1 FAD-binding oxidoreductase [Bordetella petrii]
MPSMHQVVPPSVDVAIIGGGIIGVSTAYALARAGVRVCVFEKGVLAGEQSSRNWGWVRTLDRDPAEVPLAMRANHLWGDIQACTDVGFRRTGMLYLQEGSRDAARHQHWLHTARAFGPDAMMLDRAQALRHLPESPRAWSGALYSASDGVAEPGMATQGIAGLARQHGAGVLEHCAVRGLDIEAGRVAGVVTEHGPVRAQAVLLAGGAWSRLFCGNSGIEFPQLKVRGSVLRTQPFDAPLAATVNARNFTCRKRADGGYTVSQFGASMADVVPDSFRLMGKFMRAWLANNAFVKVRFGKRFFEELAIPRRFGLDAASPFERHRVLDPVASPQAVKTAWRRLTETFPVFRGASIGRAWAGYIDVTPDALPVMSPVDGLPGFFLASGFSGHGFGIGPAAGEFMADLVLGRTPRVDARPFRFSRFTE